jgi:succinate dehydrogenase / fumarate reductase, cytochrome b subunit
MLKNIIEFGLLGIFLIHIIFTVLVVLENARARPQRYAQFHPKRQRSWATRLSTYTGSIIFIFVIVHLFDFTFTDKNSVQSVLPDGKNYGLFGLVLNTFQDRAYCMFYIAAMGALAYHLMHGIESVVQTFGLKQGSTECIKKAGYAFALAMFLAYASIPVSAYFGLIKY